MSSQKLKHSVLFMMFLLFISSPVIAKQKAGNNKKPVNVSSTAVSSTYLDINNLKALESNFGFSDYNLNSSLEGMEFPKGSGKNVVFETGLLWGGFVPGDPQVRVGGSAYISGLQPGPIMSDGTPAPNAYTDPRWRIYRVRPDIFPGGPAVDLSEDSVLEGLSQAQIRAQYEADWTDWPAAGTTNDLGAPFTDVNGDGKYEPNIDIPGVPGADQTIYYVANDQNAAITVNMYGAQPLGIELHATYWAYNQPGSLGNTYFKKYDIIHKGNLGGTTPIDSMFISFWADPDLGNANDDIVGTDTTLSLIYTYNGEPTDAVYAPDTPPSVGFAFLQGPMVNGNSADTAIFNGRKFAGKKNLPMTSSYFFINGSAEFGDPPQFNVSGSTQFYNFFNGEYGLTGNVFQDPSGNLTRFVFPGDPVAETGWLDGITNPPADRRQGMASGPFTFAPGDTQEVVFAEVAGEGSDYSHSVYTVKKYWYNLSLAYNNMLKGINYPTSPAAPITSVINDSNGVQIQWQNNAESFNDSGYTFEGYNVYQLSSSIASKEAAKLIATYDKSDGIKAIFGKALDPATDQVITQQQQFGTDSGLEYKFTATKDYINNVPYVKGKKYYYAVTAYSFNPNLDANPTNTESRFVPNTVIYNYNIPGLNYGDNIKVTHISGQADASANVSIDDPSKITNDLYQVSFHDEKYSLDSTGVWSDITSVNKKMGKISDLTGSYLTSTMAWNEKKGEIDIHFTPVIVSSNYDYCDGILIKFPLNVVIDTAYRPTSNNTGSPIPVFIFRSTNSIFFGNISVFNNPTDSTLRTQNGVFTGGEDIIVTVQQSTFPIITDYDMYDDNFGSTNGYGGKLVDVAGKDSVEGPIANKIVTQHQWNLTDLTNGNILMKNQTIYGNTDTYAPSLFFPTHFFNGPGGSSGSYYPYVNAPVAGGFKVDVSGSFSAPTTISMLELNGNPLGIYDSYANYTITDYSVFGSGDGTANSTLPIYGGAGGTTDINSLQQDYELRWTGVTGDTTINGQPVVITKSGGSFATLCYARNYNLANHPLNPNPGSNNPFLIRIPFEVWNIDKNEQVNLLVMDRNTANLNQPGVAADTFEVWNSRDRMYTWTLNTKYNSSAVINPIAAIVKDSATWNWVFFKSYFKTGDDIKIVYNNPIQIGKDIFTFTGNGVTRVSAPTDNIIKDFSLAQNYPNPFNPTTIIEYSIPKAEKVTLKIYDVLGREIRTLVNNEQIQGKYSVEFNAGNLASGVYFYRLEAGNFAQTKKLILLK